MGHDVQNTVHAQSGGRAVLCFSSWDEGGVDQRSPRWVMGGSKIPLTSKVGWGGSEVWDTT